MTVVLSKGAKKLTGDSERQLSLLLNSVTGVLFLQNDVPRQVPVLFNVQIWRSVACSKCWIFEKLGLFTNSKTLALSFQMKMTI